MASLANRGWGLFLLAALAVVLPVVACCVAFGAMIMFFGVLAGIAQSQ